MSPPLNSGTTLDTLRQLGNSPLDKEKFTRWVNKGAIVWATRLRTNTEKSFTPHLQFFSDTMEEITFWSLIGEEKNVSG